MKHKNPSGEELCELTELILWNDLPATFDSPADHSLLLTVYEHEGNDRLGYYAYTEPAAVISYPRCSADTTTTATH